MKSLRVDLTKSSAKITDHLSPAIPRGLVLGYFDGVHRGHQELIRSLVTRSAELDVSPCVFSFDRYPKPVPGHARLSASVNNVNGTDSYLLQSPLPDSRLPFKGLLQTSEQRDQVFSTLGIDALILQEFNKDFAGMTPQEFCDKILLEKLNAKVIVVGDDYRFARGQKGNIQFLQEWTAANNIEFYVFESIRVGGEILSSSRIRTLVEKGEMPEAKRLMGRYFSIPGKVIHGNALGRTVGMPTANLRIPAGMVVPEFGVYVTRTRVADTWYDSVSNVGLRPTVNHTDPLPLVETCILDREIDMYGKDIEVEFLELQRPEIRFPSFIVMSTEIAKDLAKARDWHAAHEEMYLYTYRQDIPVMISRTQRFNTAYLQVEVFVPLKKETASTYSLLSQVLTSVSSEYPSRQALQSFLDKQYGAEISAHVSKINDLQKITFRLTAVHNGLDGTKPFENALPVFLDMLFSPARDKQDRLLPSIVETERQNIRMAVLAEENERSSYAYDRAQNLLHSEVSEWVNPLGNKEELEKITDKDLHDAWIYLLSKARIHVLMSGNFGTTDLADQVSLQLASLPRAKDALNFSPGKVPLIPTFSEERTVTESESGEVSHVIVVYDGMPAYTSIYVLGGQLLTLLLGSFQHSLLYRKIREELGYAYYVDAIYDPFARTLSVISEVDPSEAEETIRVIEEEIANIRNNVFDDNLFSSVKKYYHGDLLRLRDDAEGMLNYESEEMISGWKFSCEESTQFGGEMSRETLATIAGHLKRRLVYILQPKEEGAEA